MQRYEFCVVSTISKSDESLTQELDGLGSVGYHIVGTTPNAILMERVINKEG